MTDNTRDNCVIREDCANYCVLCDDCPVGRIEKDIVRSYLDSLQKEDKKRIGKLPFAERGKYAG